jgi:hypothetical protein
MSSFKFAILLAVLFTLCLAQNAQDLTGAWQLELAFPSIGLTGIKLDMSLKQKDGVLTGAAKTATGENEVKGSVNGTDVEFTEIVPTGNAVFKGKIVDANTMQGTMDAPPYGAGNWTAKR